MSLFSCPEDCGQIRRELGLIHYYPFNLELGEFDLFNDNSLVVKVKKSVQLDNLHKDTVERLRRFVDFRKTPHYEGKSMRRKRAFQEFGSPFYDDLYNPHITIGEISDPEYLREPVENGLLDSSVFNGLVWQVHAFHLLKRDKSWEKVEVFPFKARS